MFPIRDHNPSLRFPFVTLAIIAITSYVFFLEISAPDIEVFIRQYALIPSQVNFLNPITLLPFFYSIFLHGGWLHILSNMWFLWIFGDNVEATLGHIKYFFFYIVCGLAAGLLQYFISPFANIPMLGASGAIAGVLGAYLVLYPHHKIDTIVPFGFYISRIEIPASIMLGYWFVIQLFSGFGSIGLQETGGVAFWAHVGGFVAGWILVRFLRPRSQLS